MSEIEKEIIARFLEAAENRYYTRQDHIPHGVTRTTIGWMRNLPATEDFALAPPRPREEFNEPEIIC